MNTTPTVVPATTLAPATLAPKKNYYLVGTSGYVAIIAELLGVDCMTHQDVYGFFLVVMLTEECRYTCSSSEAMFFQRITKTEEYFPEYLGFAQGYSAACLERRDKGINAKDWTYTQTLFKEEIETYNYHDEFLTMLRSELNRTNVQL